MLKRSILFTTICLFIVIFFEQYTTGPAANYVGNLTGSTGGTATCNTSSLCHGGTTSSTTSVSLTLCDSATTTSRTTYVPNTWYTVRLSGSNTLSRVRFGFQCSSTNSSGGQAGRFRAVATYTDTIINSSTTPIQIIEHSYPIAGSSGSYSTYFNWKSPASGTGTVKFYSVLNAVNYNGTADTGDKYNTGTVLSISEATATQVATFGERFDMEVYPNPVTDNAMIHLQNAHTGVYNISVFDAGGKKITTSQISVNTDDTFVKLNTSAWINGMYIFVMEREGTTFTQKIVKQ